MKIYPDFTTRGRLMTSPILSSSKRVNFLALILLIFITACAGTPFYERQGDLDDAIKYYNRPS